MSANIGYDLNTKKYSLPSQSRLGKAAPSHSAPFLPAGSFNRQDLRTDLRSCPEGVVTGPLVVYREWSCFFPLPRLLSFREGLAMGLPRKQSGVYQSAPVKITYSEVIPLPGEGRGTMPTPSKRIMLSRPKYGLY